MQIKQTKDFKPLTITLETQDEYNDFFRIIEESLAPDPVDSGFMTGRSTSMAVELSTFASNNR